MKDEMTVRERWLAAMNREPLDRLPFWPKLSAAYSAYQKGKFNEMSIIELHKYIGSDPHLFLEYSLKDKCNNVNKEIKFKDGVRTTIYTTKYGVLKAVDHYEESSASFHPVEFPIKTGEDIKIMRHFYENCDVEIDKSVLEQNKEKVKLLGEDFVTAERAGKSPLMNFIEFGAGVENAHYLLVDYPEEVEELFEAEHRYKLKCAELVSLSSPADFIYFIENTSTTLISPNQYRQLCAKHMKEYMEVLNGNGRNSVIHMCGSLKGLLDQLSLIPAKAFEAFTTPTLGDTHLKDGKDICNDKCLIGGTNAMLWTKSVDEIVKGIEEELVELDNHRGIVISSAGVMPPLCSPNTIKDVCEYIKNYNLRF